MPDPSRLPRRAVVQVIAVLAIPLGAAGPVLAEPDVSPVQAALLEAQLREAIAGVLGPLSQLPDRPIQMIAAGDHYDIVIPMNADALDGSGKARITGIARPLADGSWAVEGIRASSPLRFTSDIPLADRDSPRRLQTPVLYTMDIQGQDGRIIWDPSFATTSSWTATTTATNVHTEGATVSQDSKLGPSRSTMTLQPIGADRADLLLDAALQDYESDSLVNDAPVQFGMQRVAARLALKGLSRSRALSLAPTLSGIVVQTLAPADGQQPRSPPKSAEVTRALLAALQDFASEFTLDETIDGFAAKIQGQALGMERIKIGLAAKSDAGMLQAGMELGMEGLALPDLPLGPLGGFIPQRIALHPVISGLGVPEVTRLIQSAADGRDPNPRDVTALFSHGGIRGTLESMTVELAGTVFRAEAKLLATGPSPDSVSGSARVTAENFDQLVQKVSATAEAAQILPILVFARGAGRPTGDRFVWDLSYRNGKLFVNDVDLTAMMGGAAPSSPAPRAAGRNSPPGSGAEGPAKNAPPRSNNPKQVPSWGK